MGEDQGAATARQEMMDVLRRRIYRVGQVGLVVLGQTLIVLIPHPPL